MTLTLADKISLIRILAVPLLIVTILYYTPEADHLRFYALGIFLVAAFSDLIDGSIARYRHEQSHLGAILDPVADKILLMSAFICLYKVSVHFSSVRFPIWLIVTVVSRDVILLLGAMIIHMSDGQLKVSPSYIGKACTFFQSLSIIWILCQWPHAIYIWIVTTVLTIISGLDYMRVGIKDMNFSRGGNN